MLVPAHVGPSIEPSRVSLTKVNGHAITYTVRSRECAMATSSNAKLAVVVGNDLDDGRDVFGRSREGDACRCQRSAL